MVPGELLHEEALAQHRECLLLLRRAQAAGAGDHVQGVQPVVRLFVLLGSRSF
eukprot:COSAG06_NODE_2653_length_6493_cov_24.617870_1_plen_52_part_10